MTLPIIFIHRTDDAYLYYILRQAKLSNPNSDVILLGSKSNAKYISNDTKHFMIDDYSEGASNFAKSYKHLSSNEYHYNLFCFQRWFVLRDFMRKHKIPECWVFDSDVMLYTNINKQEYRNFSYEFTWTTITTLKDIEDLCKLQQEYFSDPKLHEDLKIFTKETGHHLSNGDLLVSDMVTQRLFFERHLKGNRVHGIYSNSFFDNNLHLSFPGVEMLDDKKKIYLIDGTLCCKKTGSNQFYKLNSVHFTTTANKKFIECCYSPNTASKNKGAYFFDYKTSQWKQTTV